MEFGNYRLDLKLTAYWVIGITIAIVAVILASSYFGDSVNLELKIDDEVEMGEQVTLQASYPGESPEITVEGDVIGEGSATYSFNESGNYTVSAEAKGESVEKTVSVVESQSGSDSTGDEDGQRTDQGQNDADGEQNNSEENDKQEDDNQAEEDSDSDDSRGRHGFIFEGELRQGEQITVELYDTGEPVSGEDLMIDGESQGETDSSGEVEVTLPYRRSVVFSTSYQGIEDELRPLKKASMDIAPTLVSPSEGKEYSIPWDSTKEVNFEFEMEDEADWRLHLNNGVEASGSGSEVSEIVELEPGSYDWRVWAEKGSETVESASRSFDIVGEPELVLLDEDSYSEVNEVNLEFSIYGDMDYYNIYVNEAIEVEEAENSVVNTFNKEFRGNYGEKEVEVEVIRQGVRATQDSMNFTVVEPVAFIDKMDYIFENGNHLLDAEVEVNEDANYAVEILEEGADQPQLAAQGTLNTGTQTIEEDLGNLNSGQTVEITLTVESQTTSKTEQQTIGERIE